MRWIVPKFTNSIRNFGFISTANWITPISCKAKSLFLNQIIGAATALMVRGPMAAGLMNSSSITVS